MVQFVGSQACHDYLITGPHGVKDSQLSASSVWGQMPDNHGPSRGRLFSDAVRYPNGTYNRGAWVARDNTQQQYIQVMKQYGKQNLNGWVIIFSKGISRVLYLPSR